MYKLFIAGRYLRSRTISFVTILGIFLSVGALIVVVSVMSGFLRESMDFIRGNMSDIVVIPRPILYTMPDGSTEKVEFNDFEAIRSVIAAVEGVKGVAPHFRVPSMIRRSDGQDTFIGFNNVAQFVVTALGIDLERETELTDFRKYLTDLNNPANRVEDPDNPFSLPDTMRNEEHFMSDFPFILIGEDRLERMELGKGDVVTLVTIDESVVEESTVKPFEQKFFIAGAFRSGHFQFDNEKVIMRIEDALAWVGAEKRLSEVCVAVDDYDKNARTIKAAIDKELTKAKIPAIVKTWEEKNSVFLGAVQNERTILGFILGFFILIATFNVFATTSMMVTDKTKDIGILVSMGATPGGILGIFLTCGFLMWLIGSILGAVAGYFFAMNVNAIKDFIEAALNVQIFNREVYNFTEIPVEISGFFITITLAGTFLLCLFFSFIPALRASLMDPVETLRHE